MRLRRVWAAALRGATMVGAAGLPAAAGGSPTPTTGTTPAPAVSDADRVLYGLEPVTEPEPLDRSELEHLAMLRRTFGVPRSLAFLRRLQADPAAYGALRSSKGLFAGMLMTPDEVPWLIARAQIDGQAGDGGRAAEAVLGPAFAGAFPSGRHYVVQCAGCDVTAVQSQLEASDLPSPLREHVDVREVRYSLADLERYREEVDALLATTDVRAGFGTMVMDNRVEIIVGVGHRKLARLVREQFGEKGPVTVTRTRIDTTDPEPVEFSGARTDGPRRLVVSFVGAAPVTDRKDGCQLDYAATARERGDTVTVAVTPEFRAVHRAGGSGFCEFLGYGRTVTVRLDRPLGGRTLVDAATGDPVPVFDGAARLRAGWLPAGWTRQGEGGGGCWSSDPVPCWNQTWGTPEAEDAAECPAGTGFVQLAQAFGPADPGVFLPNDAVTVSAATVRGHPAEVLVDSRGPGSVTVRWSEGEQSLVLHGGSSCSGAPAPASEVVLRIADGLR